MTSALGAWTPVDGVALPEARTGASALAVSDGLVMAGGRGPDGTPAATVWKADVDSKGVLKAFEAQAATLFVPVAEATIAQVGDYLGCMAAQAPTARSGPSSAATSTSSRPRRRPPPTPRRRP